MKFYVKLNTGITIHILFFEMKFESLFRKGLYRKPYCRQYLGFYTRSKLDYYTNDVTEIEIALSASQEDRRVYHSAVL